MKNISKNLKFILALALGLILTSCAANAKSNFDIEKADRSNLNYGSEALNTQTFEPSSGSFGGEVYKLKDPYKNQNFYINIYQYEDGKVDKVFTSDKFSMADANYLVVQTENHYVDALTVSDHVIKNVLRYEFADTNFFNHSLNTWEWIPNGNFKDGSIYLFQSAGSNKKDVTTFDLNEIGLDKLKDSKGTGIVIELRLSDE